MELKEALELSLKLWNELMITKRLTIPDWAAVYFKGNPACHYVYSLGRPVHKNHLNDYVCGKVCPLKTIWTTNKGCMGPGSPYAYWRKIAVTTSDKKYYAQEIRDGILRLLDELDELEDR